MPRLFTKEFFEQEIKDIEQALTNPYLSETDRKHLTSKLHSGKDYLATLEPYRKDD